MLQYMESENLYDAIRMMIHGQLKTIRCSRKGFLVEEKFKGGTKGYAKTILEQLTCNNLENSVFKTTCEE